MYNRDYGCRHYLRCHSPPPLLHEVRWPLCRLSRCYDGYHGILRKSISHDELLKKSMH